MARPLIPNARTNSASPRMPYTIEGTPARLAMLVWINQRNRPGGAYSSRKTPAPMPTGIPIKATSPSSQSVPTIPTRYPASSGSMRLGFGGQIPHEAEQLGEVRADRIPGMIRRTLQGRGQDRAQQQRQDQDSGQGRQQAGRPEDRTRDPPQTTMRLKARQWRWVH